MKLCGSCRFWGAARPYGEPEYGDVDKPDDKSLFRVCAAMKFDSGAHRFTEDPDEWNDHEDMWTIQDRELRKTEKAAAVDGSGYYGAVKTRDDFGCALHEEKE